MAYTALYGNPQYGAYMALYGAASAGHSDYKKLLHLMAKRIRTKKHLLHAKSGSKKATKLKSELKMLNKHIAHLKSKLAQQGSPTPSEAEAAAQPIASSSGSASSGGSSGHHGRGLRHLRGLHNLHHGARRHHGFQHAGGGMLSENGTDGEIEIDENGFPRARHPGHRARLPGQRGHDGRRRQGPISAQEMQTMDTSQDTAEDMVTIDDSAMTDSPVEEALSGIMDFASDLFADKSKLLTYGGIGLGVYFLWKVNKNKRRR